MTHQRILRNTALLLLSALLSLPAWSAGSGGGGIAPASSGKPKSPEQIAASQYRSGLKQKDKALKAHAKATAATSDRSRARQEKRADKAFGKAIEHFKKVLQVDPRHYKAANELGYALRRTGDYKSAIGAYNYALQLKPDFLEAIEYRGEALMNMGFFSETRKAYLKLYREDQQLAAELMAAMKVWVNDHAGEGSEPSEAEQGFADWVRERSGLTQYSADPDAQSTDGHWRS
jgi:tetratricopeptide (TPR) repeat protein